MARCWAMPILVVVWVLLLGHTCSRAPGGWLEKSLSRRKRPDTDPRSDAINMGAKKKILRKYRRREARAKKDPNYLNFKPPLFEDPGFGGWVKKERKTRLRPVNPELEDAEWLRKEYGDEYVGIGIDSTDEGAVEPRLKRQKNVDPNRPYSAGDRVVLHNLTTAKGWEGMEGVVMGAGKDGRYQIMVKHGRKNQHKTTMGVPISKLKAAEVFKLEMSDHDRRMKRLEMRYFLLNHEKFRVAKKMVRIWKNTSPDRTFYPQWYRPIVNFVKNKTRSELKILLWKKSRFRYLIPYPSGAKLPKSNWTVEPPPKRNTTIGRWEGTIYFPSYDELGLPPWKVRDAVLIDVEHRSLWRDGNITKIEYDERGVQWLYVSYVDAEDKNWKKDKTVRVLGDDYKSIRHKHIKKYHDWMPTARKRKWDSYKVKPDWEKEEEGQEEDGPKYSKEESMSDWSDDKKEQSSSISDDEDVAMNSEDKLDLENLPEASHNEIEKLGVEDFGGSITSEGGQ